MLDKIRIQTLRATLDFLPTRGTEGAAGLDLKAAIDAAQPIYPHPHLETNGLIVPCGFAIEIPKGYFGMICPRSGLARKYGITVLNGPGIIDSDYRGEIAVNLINHSKKIYMVTPGERIAQLLIMPVEMQFSLLPVATLSDTERGDKGFGSTGKN